jgi:hypothetical protein
MSHQIPYPGVSYIGEKPIQLQQLGQENQVQNGRLWPFARHLHECVTGRLTSHLWRCRGWRCAGFPFRACRQHRGRGNACRRAFRI